ncbi:hypothetical protein GCM10009582_20750 [Arthrobacter flavus]
MFPDGANPTDPSTSDRSGIPGAGLVVVVVLTVPLTVVALWCASGMPKGVRSNPNPKFVRNLDIR